jgi:hypothetical protein
MLVMALHPTGHELMAAAGGSSGPMRLGVIVHAIAIGALPLVFFGGIGISRAVAEQRSLATAALVAYGLAAVAVLSAALLSGMIATDLVQRLAAATDEAQRGMLHALLSYTGRLNQAYAKVFVSASSVAIILWSSAMLRGRQFHRGIGVYGIVIGLLTLAGLFGGHLVLDVHGEGIVIFAQAVWLILVAVRLGWTGAPADAQMNRG